ncbi:MAG: hypothetical protein KQH53_08255 [Desulfarculaceae bacterium]|nr:hypothetical protein [Desulfarculaceae bacterium]
MSPVHITLEAWQLAVGVATLCLPPFVGLFLIYLEHRGRKVFVTRHECANCHQQVINDLAAGDDAFKDLRSRDGVVAETLIAMGLAIISICGETGADCGDLPSMLRRLGGKARAE